MIARRFFSGFLLLALAVLAACGQAGGSGTSPSAAAPPAPTSPAEVHATELAAATLAASPAPAATLIPTQPAAPATEPPAVSATTVAAGATSAPAATAPMRPAASATPPANPAARLKTAVPPPKVTPMRPRGISIYGLGAGGGRRTPAQYAADVSAAARGHLAGVLSVDQASIAVARSGPLEVAVAAPCGYGGEQPKQPSPDGLAMGYEVVLDAGGRQYRYVAVGALAYPCGEGR